MDDVSLKNESASDRRAPNPASPRLAKVRACRSELLRTAEEFGATGIALCGSVARGDDHDLSDIDFYVMHFESVDDLDLDARDRADRLVKAYRHILRPYGADLQPLPGWFLGEEYEATMRRDALDIEEL